MSLPSVSEEFVDGVFTALSQMEVHLDSDPLQFGPKRLSGKVAEARGMLTECESLFLMVSQALQKYRAAHRTLETEITIEKKHLFANDPEVRAGRNVADRDALATVRLQDRVRDLALIAQSQADLEALITVIKAKRTDLKDVQGRLRDQLKLCQEEIGLGGRWGSKPVPGTKAPDLEDSPNVDKQTLKDLHEMFSGTGVKEPDLAAVVAEEDVVKPDVLERPDFETDEPALVGSDEADQDLDSLLGQISESASDSRPAQTLDELLGDLDL